MPDPTWSAVDHYICGALLPPDPTLDAILDASRAAGLPDIQVSAAQGKLLHLLVRMHGARRVLELGTLGGYSAVWIARALPEGGRLVTLEADPKHAAVASANFVAAGVADRIELRVGAALDTLPALAGERPPFDFVFIDADKPNNPAYFEWALRLVRPSGVIVVDNVVRHGEILDASSADDRVKGTRALFDQVGRASRVTATAIQTVGAKGYDGFLMAVVNP